MTDNDKTRWMSPDEVVTEAAAMMLGGKWPEGEDDWVCVLNCIAYNQTPETALPVTNLIAHIYGAPVQEGLVEAIVLAQQISRYVEDREAARADYDVSEVPGAAPPDGRPGDH